MARSVQGNQDSAKVVLVECQPSVQGDTAIAEQEAESPPFVHFATSEIVMNSLTEVGMPVWGNLI